MIVRNFERILINVGFVLMLTGCFWFDENSQGVVTSKHYTETSSDCQTVLNFDDSQSGIAELIIRNFSATRVIPGFFPRCGMKSNIICLFGPATTETLVRNTVIGPINSRIFRLKLNRLSGDSTLQLSSEF